MRRPWRVFREVNADFDQRVLSLPDNSYLDGYWQSPKYFNDVAERLREEITPVRPLVGPYEDIAKSIRRSNSVSVHVRRGDYVTSRRSSETHGTCPPHYYERAVEHISNATSDPHFFVFSDDLSWVRRNLTFSAALTLVEHQNGGDPISELRLMSLCRHHIIANSSFSWWGAWLNASDEKMVLAPSRWFNSEPAMSDLFPHSWIRL